MKAKNKKQLAQIRQFMSEKMIVSVERQGDNKILIPVNHQPYTGRDVLIIMTNFLQSIGIDSMYTIGLIRFQFYPESWTLIIGEYK